MPAWLCHWCNCCCAAAGATGTSCCYNQCNRHLLPPTDQTSIGTSTVAWPQPHGTFKTKTQKEASGHCTWPNLRHTRLPPMYAVSHGGSPPDSGSTTNIHTSGDRRQQGAPCGNEKPVRWGWRLQTAGVHTGKQSTRRAIAHRVVHAPAACPMAGACPASQKSHGRCVGTASQGLTDKMALLVPAVGWLPHA